MRILWIPNGPLTEGIRGENFAAPSLDQWKGPHPDLVIERLFQPLPTNGLQFELPLSTHRILIVDEMSGNQLRLRLNQAHVDYILEAKDLSRLREYIEKIEETVLHRTALERNRDAYSKRNRDLEILTEALEKEVAVRTTHLESSTIEEREKLRHERQLIRFLTEIGSHQAVDDILNSLRHELRPFHRLQGMTMVWSPPGGVSEARSFQNGSWKKMEISLFQDWWTTNDDGLRLFFANLLGRPFQKAFFSSLKTELGSRALFAFEYGQMVQADLDSFRQIWDERSQPVMIALERIFLEEDLKRAIWRWERTFDTFQNPIAVIDIEGNVLRGNSAFSQQSRQKKCYEIFAKRNEPCDGCVAGISQPSPLLLGGLSGEIRHSSRVYQMHCWPVQESGSNHFTARVHHYYDMTESRSLYLRYLQSEKMSALGELAGHIAHELNNPLTGIRSLAQLLLADQQFHDQHADIQQIEMASKRCQNIIKFLLDFASGGDGHPVLTNLDEIVMNTLPLLKTALRPHRHRLELRTYDAKIFVDPHLLQQVVFNLVNNACQAMVTSGVIEVSTSRSQEGDVHLVVADSGPGVPEELHEKIFDAFFTTKNEGEGTGLGLSTCKALLERFGGTIWVENRKQGGAEFHVQLPIKANTK